MSQYRLSFCDVEIIANNISEATADANIEIDNVMIREYHDWLKQELDG